MNTIFDKLGTFADRLDAILAMENVPMPEALKKMGRTAAMSGLRDDMREAYVEHTGENPLGRTTMTPTPTPQQIIELAREAGLVLTCDVQDGYIRDGRYKQQLDRFATLLLERFGQQTAVAQDGCDYCNHPLFAGTKCKNCGKVFEEVVAQEPYCYTYTEDSEEYFALPTAYVPNDAIPLYTHPAPAEVREPLTDDWIRSRCSQTWVFDTVKRWVKEVEAAHGITGSKA